MGRADEAAMLLVVAEGHVNCEEDKLAITAARDAMAIFREVSDADGAVDCIRIIITALFHSGIDVTRKEAYTMASEELAKCREAGDEVGEAKMLVSLGEVCAMLRPGRTHKEALKGTRDAIEIFKKRGLKKMEGIAQLAIVNIEVFEKQKIEDCGARESLEGAKEALRIFQEIGDRKYEAHALRSHQVGLILLHDIPGAVRHSEAAIEIYKELGLKHCALFELQCIAHCWLLETNKSLKPKPELALLASEEALVVSRDIGGRDGREARSLSSLCRCHLRMGHPEKAMREAQEGLERFQEIGDLRGEAESLFCIVLAHSDMGEDELALRPAHDALELFQELDDKDTEAHLSKLIGNLHIRLENFDKAKRSAKETLELYEDMGNETYEEAVALQTISAMSFHQGDMEAAVRVGNHAYDLMVECGSQRGQAAGLLFRAACKGVMNDTPGCVEAAKQASAFFRVQKDSESEAVCVKMILDCKMELKEFEEALRQAERLRALWRDAGCKISEVHALEQISQIGTRVLTDSESTSKQAWDKIIRTCKEAIAIARKTGDRNLVGSALVSSTQAYMMSGKAQEALKAATEGLALFKKTGDQLGQGHAHVALGDVYIMAGQPQMALDSGTKAMELYQSIPDEEGIKRAEELLNYFKQPEQPQGQIALSSAEQAQQAPGSKWGPANFKHQPQQQESSDIEVRSMRERGPIAKPEGAFDDDTARKVIGEVTKSILGLAEDEELEYDMPLMESGLTSNTAIVLRDELAKELGKVINLPVTLVFDYPSVASIAELLVEATNKPLK